jgi:lantibiotic biosynthesis protein
MPAITVSAIAPLLAGRVPMLPIDAIVGAYEHLAMGDIDALRRPIVDFAIEIASPELAAALERVANRPGKKRDRAFLKLLAYVSRMATRATPYGAFASVGTVQVGPATSLRLQSGSTRIQTRPDMSWLLPPLRSRIGRAWESLAALRVRFSDEALAQGDRLYVFPTEAGDNGAGMTPAASLRLNAVVRSIRELAADWIALGDLTDALGARTSLPAERCRAILTTLWEQRILLDELAISPVSSDVVADVARVLLRVHPETAAEIEAYLERLAELDRRFAHGELGVDYVRETERFAQQLAPAMCAFQSDAVHAFQGELGRNVVASVERLGALLVRGGQVAQADGLVRAFRHVFEGEGRLVPFLEFADAMLDLGPTVLQASAVERTPEAKTLIAEIAFACSRSGAIEVDLSEAELAVLFPVRTDASPPFIPTFEIGFQIAASSAQAVDDGDFRIWPGNFRCAARAGASLARFANVLELPLRRIAEAHRVETGALEAELVFTPLAPRIYNVLTRPPVQDYEVHFGTASTGENATRIAPADLLVGVDDENRLFVWSRALQREVSVVETNTFATDRLGPFGARLLAAIAASRAAAPRTFDWGSLSEAPFLPRLRAGNLILSRARWRFVPPKQGRTSEAHAQLSAFRERWRMPRYVMLLRGDNNLFLDLDSALAHSLLELESGTPLTFDEALAPGDHWLRGDDGAYAAEFVCSFTCVPAQAPLPRTRPQVVEARRIPGSAAWFYADLHCTAHRMETVLRAYVQPMIDAVAPPVWFFVRYRSADGTSHLRLRLQLGPAVQRAGVVEQLDRWTHEGLIRKWSERAYERELERYGGEAGLGVCEQIFALSSARVLETLARRPQEREELVLDAADFMFALQRSFVSENETAAWLDFARPREGTRKLDDWQRRQLTRAGAGDLGDDAERLDELCAHLRALHERRELTARPFDVLAALGHMHCNRLGLDGDEETRARVLAWHTAYRLRARTVAAAHAR